MRHNAKLTAVETTVAHANALAPIVTGQTYVTAQDVLMGVHVLKLTMDTAAIAHSLILDKDVKMIPVILVHVEMVESVPLKVVSFTAIVLLCLTVNDANNYIPLSPCLVHYKHVIMEEYARFC